MQRIKPLSDIKFEAAYRALCTELTALGIRIEGGKPGDDRWSHHFRDHLAKMWCEQQPISDGGFVIGHDEPRYGKLFAISWLDSQGGHYVEVTNFGRTVDASTTNRLNAVITAALALSTT